MSDDPPSTGGRPFRWQALLQRASEAVFVLDRRRRLRFVNHGWEALTGFSAQEARGLVCRRSAPVSTDALPEDALAHLLTPPPDVHAGQPCRTRRRAYRRGVLPPGSPRWWDIDFLPLGQAVSADDKGGYLVIGRILPVAESAGEASPVSLLPERLVDLRQRHIGRFTFDLLDSVHPAMQRLAEQARLAASLAMPLMLVGEAGTGKHTLARILHAQGLRNKGSFCALNCRLLPPAAVAEVVQGQGTPRSQAGLLYLACPDFLPKDIQRSLCDRLAHGSEQFPRLVAGFATDPAEAVRTGRLLDQLFWKMSIFRLDLLPLRHRPADLPRLVERLLGEPVAREKPMPRALSEAAWEACRTFAWPGNLRELRQVMQKSAARAKGDWIELADLPSPIRLARLLEGEPISRPRPLDLERLLVAVESRLIDLALRRARGNRTRAAELLGIHRPRLTRRIEALGLESPGSEPPAEG